MYLRWKKHDYKHGLSEDEVWEKDMLNLEELWKQIYLDGKIIENQQESELCFAIYATLELHDYNRAMAQEKKSRRE